MSVDITEQTLTPIDKVIETEAPKTADDIAKDIQQEKEKYEEIQKKSKTELILDNLREIYDIMFIWYIDNITYEYIYTEDQNRKVRYEKKEVEKGGKIKIVKTNTKKTFYKNLEDLEKDTNKYVNMFENKSDIFSVVKYDESWFENDTLKPKQPPADPKELYERENMIPLIVELSHKSISDEEKNEYIESMKKKLQEQWKLLDPANKEIYKKHFFKTNDKNTKEYEQAKEEYLENKRIEMSFIPYYYRYFVIVYQQIYSKYFTYDYIRQGKNNNLFVSVIIVIMASIKSSLNNNYSIQNISEIIKLLYGFIYKIERIDSEQNNSYQKMVFDIQKNMKSITKIIENTKVEDEKEKLFGDLEAMGKKKSLLTDYNDSSKMLTKMAINGLQDLMKKYRSMYIELESQNIPSGVSESDFRSKMEESVNMILYYFKSFLKQNDLLTSSFYSYISNSYLNIYLVRKDMESFPSLKKEFDDFNTREESKSIDMSTKAGKAAAKSFETSKKVDEIKKCEICGKTGKVNFSKAQWSKQITESRKCKECVLKEKEEQDKKAAEAKALATTSELIDKEQQKAEKEKERERQKAEKAAVAAEEAATQSAAQADLKEKKQKYETSIDEINKLLKIIEQLKIEETSSKLFYPAQREDAEKKFKLITKILNENGFGKLVMVGNYSIYKLMEKIIGTDISRIGIATDDIDGKLCLNIKDKSLELIREELNKSLVKEELAIKMEAGRDNNDPNTPIKVLSSITKKPVIDITFSDGSDKRCDNPMLLDEMFIADANSTLSHYLDIFSSLKKDDETYDERMIKEISKLDEKYNIPLWKTLINEAKQTDGIYKVKGFSVNIEMFPVFLGRKGITREAQKEFMTKLVSFDYKLPSWKGSLERLKMVFEKLIEELDIGDTKVEKGGHRKTRKNSKRKRKTYKRNNKKGKARKILNHWKRKTLKRIKIKDKKKKHTTQKRVKRK